jgi:hypothetical protein
MEVIAVVQRRPPTPQGVDSGEGNRIHLSGGPLPDK